MRIVQISDIHLDSRNIEDLKHYYMNALIEDLKNFHLQKPIEVILITGDLVDKGGNSLGEDPYKIFQKEIIAPLTEHLGINSKRVLLIPGNHDINQEHIEVDSEFFLSQKLDPDLANERANAFHSIFNKDNKRIQKFKEFEKIFHSQTENYNYSNNESVVIVEAGEHKIGFALINDSWRCSSQLKKEQHFIGYKQLFRARNTFNEKGSDLNIAVFHHPLNAINDEERAEIKNILKTKNFDIAIFGHSHRYANENVFSSAGGYLSLNGRSAFSDPKEVSSFYQPGYNILDVDPDNRKYKIIARKFIRNSGFRFDKDTDSLPDGEESGIIPQDERLYPLAEDTNNEDKDLPDSYTADVDRIVGLLIGESIYPNKYAFIRELIQNSVDACNRIKDIKTHSTPKITIKIDAEANFFEVIDEGDGMTKHVIKNHFAVIGKSISQEYNDNNNRSNLISKFGIGFISTFIAAEKVVISTKSEEDGLIIFEIEDVFKGFQYKQPSSKDSRMSTGTTVRVYLKKGYDTNVAYNTIRKYCRHIENLEINHNSSVIKIDERWNVEDSLYFYREKNTQYELRLGLSTNTSGIIASYSGFLISNYPSPIIPYRFPSNIVGEINFSPKSIDFDVSRTNIITSAKSESVRREVSQSIRNLFRNCLENVNSQIYPIVVNYLHYYLQYYDTNQANFDRYYKDFYSKKELISLCSEHTIVDFDNSNKKLNEVLGVLKVKSIDKIYVITGNVNSDYIAIIIQYLKSKGNFVFTNRNQNVSFHDIQQQQINLISVIQIIAAEHSITVQDVTTVHPSILSDMTMDKSKFPEKIQSHISKIQRDYSVVVEIGKFSQTLKPSVNNGNQIFLNYEHATFQSLLKNVESIDAGKFEVYLLGLLGLQLNDLGTQSKAR